MCKFWILWECCDDSAPNIFVSSLFLPKDHVCELLNTIDACQVFFDIVSRDENPISIFVNISQKQAVILFMSTVPENEQRFYFYTNRTDAVIV